MKTVFLLLSTITGFTFATSALALDAIATLSPTKDSAVSGKITFHDEGQKIKVEGEVSGLEPNSEHGFHIHEFGDCSAPDGASAGGHFNPTKQPHGPLTAAHHAGDFGNIKADATGKAKIATEIAGVSLSGAETILGRGVIVHKAADDLKTQPTGNAGARLACGVIGVSAAAGAPAKK